jgi:protein-serine/threonine kinase
LTVEKAASAKIFFECHYNDLFTASVSPRSMRRRELERELHHGSLSLMEQQERREKWAKRESEYLREVRAMKARVRGSKNTDGMASSFELVKVLGKGSFGVVRLVREKSPRG